MSIQAFPKPVQIMDSGNVDIVERLAALKGLIKGDFLVLYGDTISDIDVAGLIEFHKSHSEPATVSVWPLKSQFGIMDINSHNKVIDYNEKPTLNKWINIGYFYFAQKMLDEMKDFSRYEDFLEHLMKTKQLNAYKHDGIHLTVNSLRDLEEAELSVQKIGYKKTHGN
jgi:glucose-1-phosphate cytidylyltransferase